MVHESFRELYQFYTENKDKIHMPPDQVGIHPINQEAVQRWMERISRLENPEEREFYLFFAKGIAEFLKNAYITYPVFLERVHAVAEELYEKMVSGPYETIWFLVNQSLQKSNLWVCLLMMDVWTANPKFVREIAEKIRVNGAPKSPKPTDPPSLLLYFDDMIYSGGQAGQATHVLSNEYGLDLTYSGSTTPVDYVFAVPFVATFGYSYILQNLPRVKFCKATRFVPSIFELFTQYTRSLPATDRDTQYKYTKYLNRIGIMCSEYSLGYTGTPKWERSGNRNWNTKNKNNIRKGMWAFRCAKIKTLVYFDHKLADDASTFQKLLYFGSYPIDEGNVCEMEPLITGCAIAPQIKSYMTEHRINACRDYIQTPGSKLWNLDQAYICPPTFYKSIPYTYGYVDPQTRKQPRPMNNGRYARGENYISPESLGEFNRDWDLWLSLRNQVREDLSVNDNRSIQKAIKEHNNSALEKNRIKLNIKDIQNRQNLLRNTFQFDELLENEKRQSALWKKLAALNEPFQIPESMKRKQPTWRNRFFEAFGGKPTRRSTRRLRRKQNRTQKK